jgi:hypothetical protein
MSPWNISVTTNVERKTEKGRGAWLTLVSCNMGLPFILRTRERKTSLPERAIFLPLINSALQIPSAWVTLLEHKVPHTSERFFPFLVVRYVVPWTVNKTFFPASWAAWILVLYFLPVCSSLYCNNHRPRGFLNSYAKRVQWSSYTFQWCYLLSPLYVCINRTSWEQVCGLICCHLSRLFHSNKEAGLSLLNKYPNPLRKHYLSKS